MKNILNHQVNHHSDQAEWIVFLHGAGGSIQTWKHQIEALKPHFNLLLIDLRDHGLSKNIQPAYKTYNFDIVVSDIERLLMKIGLKKAHFVSLSFGSVLIQALYARHPHLVDKIVIVGGVFNANWMIKGFVHLARFFNLFLTYSSMYKVFSYLLMPRKNHQKARRIYQQQARKLTHKEYLKWLGLYSEFFHLLRSFHGQIISNDFLIIMGTEDYLFLPSAKKFAESKPGVHLKLVAKAGHVCNIEKPAEVNVLILDFLHSHTDRSERPLTREKFGAN